MLKKDTKELAANAKFYESYARYDDDKQRYEAWEESVARVFDTHRKKFNDKLTAELESLLQYAQNMYNKKRILGAQRALQFGGDQLLAHEFKLYNCTSGYLDRLEFFGEYMYLLLCGAGVGFSVQKHHVAKLPKASPRSNRVVQFIIPDSIEGWAEAIDVLVSSFFEDGVKFPQYSGKKVYFDFSQIRPRGSKISGGFKAPGPEPLRKCIAICEEILTKISYNGGEIKPIDAYDIAMHIADAVISGGVRRAATIALFSPDDEEMMKAKTGNWYIDNPQRARSNNSVMLVRDETSHADLAKMIESIKQFGEPGFILTENREFTYNPCFTKDTKVLTSDGWRSFAQIEGSTPTIIQDNRVIGFINDNEEHWSIDLNANGVTHNTATKVGMTQQNQDVYKLSLSCGREVKATANHGFATTNGMINLEDLHVGDEILIGVPDNYTPDKESIDFKAGNILGLIYGDGVIVNDGLRIEIWGDENLQYISKIQNDVADVIAANMDYLAKFVKHNTIKMPEFELVECDAGNKTKYRMNSMLLKLLFDNISGGKVSKDNVEWLHSTSKDFKSGFLSGMFWADGHTEWNVHKNTVSVSLSSSEKENLRAYQLILQELGVFSKIHGARPEGARLLPSSDRNTKKEYNCKESYRLVIGGRQQCDIARKILSLADKDVQKLDNAFNSLQKAVYKTQHKSYVSNIEYIGKEDVYCLQENNRRTLIAEGMTARRCVEIGMLPTTDDGRTGFQACNLTEINGSQCDTKEKFFDACKAAAITGTIQAGYTNFKYVSEATKEIVEKEALLGVSITGWMNNPQVLFDENVLREGAEIVKHWNKIVAGMLGINVAARTTCVKPSGNACTTFDTLIKTENGDMTLHDIFKYCTKNKIDIDSIGSSTEIQVINPLKVFDHNNELQDISGLYFNGNSYVYEIEFEDGACYKFTENHKLKTRNGWKLVSELTEDDEIVSFE